MSNTRRGGSELLDLIGSSPSVGAANTGRLAYDLATQKLRISLNGGAFVDLTTLTEASAAISAHAALTSGIHGISAFGATLVDDANAATARTTLELGTAATTATTAYEAAGAIATHAALTSGVHGITVFGASLVNDVDAAAARTTLALATVASSASAADLSAGTLLAARMPALTGEVTTTVGTVATTITADAVTNAKLANMAASTIKGNNTGGAADPLDLTTAQVKTLLAIAAGDVSGLAAVATSGSAADLSAGTLLAARMPALTGPVTTVAGNVATTITANAVGDTHLRDSAALSVIGRATNSTGDPADIAAGVDGDVLRRSGTALGFGAIPQASVTSLVSDLAGKVATTRTISTTAPLTGGGDLSANRTFAVNTFGAAQPGVVPLSGGGSTNFLRADGTWAAPPANAPAAGSITTTELADNLDLSVNGSTTVGDFRGKVFATTTGSGTVAGSASIAADITVWRMTVGAPTIFNGITAAGRVDGSILWVYVNTGTAVFNHENASAAAVADRFSLPNAAAWTLPNGGACFVYDGTASRWRLYGFASTQFPGLTSSAVVNAVTGSSGVNTLLAGFTSTAQTATNIGAVSATNTGTFNTTAGALASHAIRASNTATKSAGANDLTNYGLYATASGANFNYAAWLEGETRVNGYLGVTGLTNANTFAASQAGTGQTANNTNVISASTAGATYNTTAGALNSATVSASATATKSAGGNNLTNLAYYADASGGDVNHSFYGANGTLFNAGPMTINGATALNGTATVGNFRGTTISPANLAVDTHNWNPASLSTATVIRIEVSAGVSITGLSGGVEGRVLVLFNSGSNTITFTNNDISAVGFRFMNGILDGTGGDVKLRQYQAAMVVFTGNVWNFISIPQQPPAWSGKIYGAYGDCDPGALMQHIQRSGTIAPTPTQLGTSEARCALFMPPETIQIANIRWYSVGTVAAGVFRCAIYSYSNTAPTRVTADLSMTCTANAWSTVATSAVLQRGKQYFIAVSATTTGATAGPVAMGTTPAATTGLIQIAPQSLPGNLQAGLGFLPGYLFDVGGLTAGALPATMGAPIAFDGRGGGMPAFFLDNA